MNEKGLEIKKATDLSSCCGVCSASTYSPSNTSGYGELLFDVQIGSAKVCLCHNCIRQILKAADKTAEENTAFAIVITDCHDAYRVAKCVVRSNAEKLVLEEKLSELVSTRYIFRHDDWNRLVFQSLSSAEWEAKKMNSQGRC